MKKRLSFVCMLSAVVLSGVYAAPPEAVTQGYYEGAMVNAGGSKSMVARVVTLGKGAYKVFIQSNSGRNDARCVELLGKVEGDAVVFKGSGVNDGWAVSCSAGKVKGSSGADAKIAMKRVERKSATLGKKPPEGAVVLLDGKSFDELKRSNGREWEFGKEGQEGWGIWEVSLSTMAKEPKVWPAEGSLLPEGWKLTKSRRRVEDVNILAKDGSIQIPKGGMRSTRVIKGSFDYHVEFMIPIRAEARSQGRGNSGVFFPCGTEIQVLDSFGMPTYTGGCCGGLYKWINPDAMQDIPSLKDKKSENKFNLASLPPMEWQTYDIEYRVKAVQNGKKESYLTAYQNGIKIHDNVKLRRPFREGNLQYQDHGNPVRYRNIWFVPVD